MNAVMKGHETQAPKKSTRITNGLEGTAGVTRRMLSVSGEPVCVYEAGPKDSPAVVLLHGAMYDESRFIWDQMFPALSERYHVFAVDSPRHGKSRPWTGVLDRARLMEIFSEVFRQLALPRFSIVGLSMGGGLAIEYAASHPEQVRSMALFEPGGLGDKADLELLTWLYTRVPRLLHLMSRQYARYDDAKIEKALRSIYTKGTEPRDPARLTAILKDEMQGKFASGEQALDDWQISAMGPMRLKWNLLDKIAALRCPTLWLRGTQSALVKQHEIERAVRIAKTGGADAELALIPHAGHMLPLEQAEQANAVVLAFLDRTTE
jgi:pimeloyl-ACP methyl ester carboxylesterase